MGQAEQELTLGRLGCPRDLQLADIHVPLDRAPDQVAELVRRDCVEFNAVPDEVVGMAIALPFGRAARQLPLFDLLRCYRGADECTSARSPTNSVSLRLRTLLAATPDGSWSPNS